MRIEKGNKLNLKRDAVLSVGRKEANPIVEWTIDKITLDSNGNVDYITFKGKKTEYRFNGNRIYSITGPVREYKII